MNQQNSSAPRSPYAGVSSVDLSLVRDDDNDHGWNVLQGDFRPEPDPAFLDTPIYVASGNNLRGLADFHGMDKEPVGLSKKGDPVKLGFRLTDLKTLFEKESTKDSHVCVYAIEDHEGTLLDRIPRLTKPGLGAVLAAGWFVYCRTVWIDLDLKDLIGRPGKLDPPKLKWVELTDDEREFVAQKIDEAREALRAKDMPWGAEYRTESGFRFLHALAIPVPAGDGYEALVGRFLAAYNAAGLPVDEACKDWTRLFRAPRVTKESGQTTWDQEWSGQAIEHRDDSYFYAPSEKDLRPIDVAPTVAIERTAGRPTPDPIQAQQLVEFYDDNGRKMRQTAPGKAAKAALRDSAVYPWIYDRMPLAYPGKRHEMLTRAVGEVVGTLHGMPAVSPEFIFGLLYEPAGRFGEDEDWIAKLWEMTTSFYDKEELKKAQKAAVAEQAMAEAKDPRPQDVERPNVLVGIDDDETFRNMRARMVAQNTVRPQFFATLDGKLAQVRGDRIEELSGLALAAFLARRFRFYLWKDNGKGERTECTVNPPRGLAPIVQGSSDFDHHLPTVETVQTVPAFNLETGESFAEGYDQHSRTFVVARPGLRYDLGDDGAAAVQFLAHHLLHDFPFASKADRTNALAWLLTCATAPSWGTNPTPIFLLDAPKVSSGKTLLASVGAVLAGVDNAISSVSGGSEELDKIVAAVARGGRPVWVLDNLKGKVESKTLAGIATATGGTTEVRVFGQTVMVEVRSNNAKAITGNNLSLDADNNRRAVRSRIDAQDPHPERRDPSKFLHPRLHAWAIEHRGELIAAAHTVIRSWILAGRPDLGAATVGSFETWSFTIGNALAHAGVSDFLGNRDDQGADDDTETLRAVLAALAGKFGDRDFTAAQALASVQVLVGAENAKDAKALGYWLRSYKENRVLLDDGRQVWLQPQGKGEHGSRWRVMAKPAG